MNEKGGIVVRVLIADDEKNIADPIAYMLNREGFETFTAYDGEQAIEILSKKNIQIAILDVSMPKKNGYDVCRSIDVNSNIGIIFLTAKNDDNDKILGLELGADDYITKPFNTKELIARVRALGRRISKIQIDTSSVLSFDELVIDLQKKMVRVLDKDIVLARKEYELLVLLAKNINRVFTRDELLDKIWSIDYPGGTRTVDIHIQRLRKKLGESCQDLIQTVYGIGYRFFYED